VHESTFVKRMYNNNMSVKSVTVGARTIDRFAGGDNRRSELKGIPTVNNIHTCTSQVYCNVSDDCVSEPVDREPRTDAKTAIGRRVFVSTRGRTDKLARKRARRGV